MSRREVAGANDQRPASERERSDPLVDGFAVILVLGFVFSVAYMTLVPLLLVLLRLVLPLHEENGLFVALLQAFRASIDVIKYGAIVVLLGGFACWGVRDLWRWFKG